MEQLARSVSQVANAIRRKRRKLSLTQTQVSEMSCLRQATISALEAGHGNPRLETLLMVLTVLDLELVVRDRTRSPKIEDIF